MKEGRNTYPCQPVATPTYPSGAKVRTFCETRKQKFKNFTIASEVNLFPLFML